MKQLILTVIWALATAIPASNAQQASPSKTTASTTAMQPTSKPKRVPVHSSPQPTIHPTPKLDFGQVKTADNNRVSFTEAVRRYRHERHDQVWWKRHYVIIVLVGGGYYYWNSGYWCPAWGYDPNYENYDYDGPICTYGNLLPDQVIINVQHALKELGYYAGDVTGSLGASTRRVLSAYQKDYGLDVTGAPWMSRPSAHWD
jgi:hypothetical protein